MDRIISWLRRSRDEGLSQTAQRVKFRLTRQYRRNQSQKWFQSEAMNWTRKEWGQSLIPDAQHPEKDAIKRLQRTTMLSETARQFLGKTGQTIPVTPTDIKEGRLNGLHPLFQTHGDIQWNRSYGRREGPEWPSNYPRDQPLSGENCPGDIRLTWEKNRLQFLIPNLLANSTGSQETNHHLLLAVVEDWQRHNPFGHGVQWRDTQEVGLRMKVILRIASEAAHDEELLPQVEGLLPLIAQHGLFVEHFISDGPDTHNHILTELCAQLHFRYLFNPGARAVVERKLLTEIRKQFWQDGSPGEGSINYHLFVLESLIELYLHAETAHPLFANRLGDAIAPLTNFALSILNKDGTWPAIGDTDSGWGSGLFIGESPSVRTRLQHFLQEKLPHTSPSVPVRFEGLGMVVFPVPDEGDIKGWMLLGPEIPRPGVHRSHHHADRLSLVIRKDKTWLLADPGTTSYNGTMTLRERDRRTESHSCPGIKGEDQMDVTQFRFGTGPLPRRRNTIHHTDTHFYTAGATVSSGAVRLRRVVKWHRSGKLVLILDKWDGDENFTPQTSFVTGPGVSVLKEEHRTELHHPDFEGAAAILHTWCSTGIYSMESTVSKGHLSERYGTQTETDILRMELPETKDRVYLLTVLSMDGEALWNEITGEEPEFLIGMGQRTFRCLQTGHLIPDRT